MQWKSAIIVDRMFKRDHQNKVLPFLYENVPDERALYMVISAASQSAAYRRGAIQWKIRLPFFSCSQDITYEYNIIIHNAFIFTV